MSKQMSYSKHDVKRVRGCTCPNRDKCNECKERKTKYINMDKVNSAFEFDIFLKPGDRGHGQLRKLVSYTRDRMLIEGKCMIMKIHGSWIPLCVCETPNRSLHKSTLTYFMFQNEDGHTRIPFFAKDNNKRWISNMIVDSDEMGNMIHTHYLDDEDE